jgi:DNA-directed RNA polymerase subunit RPC12/RpoP
MGKDSKIKCPYCHSDDCYQDSAMSMRNIVAWVLSFIGKNKGFLTFNRNRPALNTYHCFNCGKDFTEKEI